MRRGELASNMPHERIVLHWGNVADVKGNKISRIVPPWPMIQLSWPKLVLNPAQAYPSDSLVGSDSFWDKACTCFEASMAKVGEERGLASEGLLAKGLAL